MIRKYPEDSDLQALHALRIGLCVKIDKGTISLENAIDIFDRAHQAVIEKAIEERNRFGVRVPFIGRRHDIRISAGLGGPCAGLREGAF